MRQPINSKDFQYFTYPCKVGEEDWIYYRMDAPSGTYIVGRANRRGRPSYVPISTYFLKTIPLFSSAKRVDWEQLPSGAQAILVKLAPDFEY